MAMEDFRVDVVVGKGPGATAIPLEINAVHPGRRHHPGRAAHRPAARPVRLRRPDGVLRDRRPGAGAGPQRRPARCPAHPRRLGGDRRPVPGHARGSPTGCCAGSATTPRCAPTGGSPSTSPARRWPSTTSTTWAWTGWTARCSTPWSAGSAAARSGVHPGGRGGGGAAHRRGGVRAVPGARRPAGPHAARPGGHRGRVPAPGPSRTAGRSRSQWGHRRPAAGRGFVTDAVRRLDSTALTRNPDVPGCPRPGRPVRRARRRRCTRAALTGRTDRAKPAR